MLCGNCSDLDLIEFNYRLKNEELLQQAVFEKQEAEPDQETEV